MKFYLKYFLTVIFLYPPLFGVQWRKEIILWMILAIGMLAGSEGLTAQNKIIDSLKRVLLSDAGDSVKVNALNTLAYGFARINADSTLMFASQALTMAKKNNLRFGISSSYFNLGKGNKELGNFSKAIEEYTFALEIDKEIAGSKDKKTSDHGKSGMSDDLSEIGVIFTMQGNYAKALEFQLRGLKLAEEINNKSLQAKHMISIGTLYDKMLNYELGMSYYQKAAKIYEESGQKNYYAMAIGNIGATYENMGNYDEALNYALKTLRLFGETGNKEGEAILYGNIGLIYLQQAEGFKIKREEQKAKDLYKKSEEYYLRSLQMHIEHKDLEGKTLQLYNLGSLYLVTKNIPAAKLWLQKSLAEAKQINYKEIISNSCQKMSAVDSIKGDYKNAYENYKLFIVFRDSINNEENTKKTIQTQMQYDFDKRSAADSIKNSEAKKFEEVKHQQEISKQKTFTYGGIIGFLVMIIVAGISYKAFRNKKKANVEIQRQKHLVEEKQKEILDSIYYARRIQRALITNEKYIERKLNGLNRSK